MSEMLEKVGRALADEARFMYERDPERWNDAARAAIAALTFAEDGSDCPEHVRIAGEEAYAENGDCRAIFNAMLSAALPRTGD